MPRCRGCGGELDPWLLSELALSAEGGQRPGLHPTCSTPPEPMLPRLEAMLDEYQNNTPRSLQVELGPSEIGDPCGRRIALKLANPRKQAGLKWGALLGLFGHAGVEEAVGKVGPLM